jgi:hypothetical protein
LITVDNVVNCFTSSEYYCLQHYVHCQYSDSHFLEISFIVYCLLFIVLQCFILLQTLLMIVDCFHFIVHCFILSFIVPILLFYSIVHFMSLLFIVLFYCSSFHFVYCFFLIVHCLHFIVQYEYCVYCYNIVLVVTIF